MSCKIYEIYRNTFEKKNHIAEMVHNVSITPAVDLTQNAIRASSDMILTYPISLNAD